VKQNFKSTATLDELLIRLDSQWMLCEVPKLVDFLSELPETEHDAKTELCAADLEWRWRMSENHQLQRNLVAANDITLRPSACEYSRLLGESWDREVCRQQMTESEWIARSTWGDKPHVGEFVGQDPFRLSLTESLVEQLDLVAPMRLRVERGNEIIFEIGNLNTLTIGRQRRSEPAAPAWVPESRRLVIADLAENAFSRDQCLLKRVRAREIEMTNLSAKNALTISFCVLGPGESFHFPVPLEFSINNFNLRAFVVEGFRSDP